MAIYSFAIGLCIAPSTFKRLLAEVLKRPYLIRTTRDTTTEVISVFFFSVRSGILYKIYHKCL